MMSKYLFSKYLLVGGVEGKTHLYNKGSPHFNNFELTLSVDFVLFAFMDRKMKRSEFSTVIKKSL